MEDCWVVNSFGSETVLRSRHFFGRLRHRLHVAKVPEPTPHTRNPPCRTTVPVAGGQQGSRPLSQQNVQRVAAPFGALPPLEHGLTVAVVVVEHGGAQRVRRPDPASRRADSIYSIVGSLQLKNVSAAMYINFSSRFHLVLCSVSDQDQDPRYYQEVKIIKNDI